MKIDGTHPTHFIKQTKQPSMLKRIFSIATFSVLAISVLLTPEQLQAQGLKVGYTDHGIIILNMPRYQAIQEELQQEYMGSQEALQSLYADYQEDIEKYEKQAPLLSAESRQAREQELLKKAARHSGCSYA